MIPLSPLPPLRRPRGLAARAVVFTTLLVAVTAALSTGVVLLGTQSEVSRHEVDIARDLTVSAASRLGDVVARGDSALVARRIQGVTRNNGARAFAVHDASGALLAQEGGSGGDNAIMGALALRALGERQVVHQRTDDGAVVVAAPMVRDGHITGAVVRMWEPGAYRFDVLTTIAPLLLSLGCLILVSMLLTARVVRRMVAPLDLLARFAERVGERGTAEAIDLRTGDEFETLANAFNNMTARLDRSMRQIQEIAFVDPATRLPNHERFVREVDHCILQNNTGAVILLEFQRLPRLMQTLDPDAARELLRLVAEKLTSSVRTVSRIVRRSDEPAVCARLGGAEFAVFAPKLAQADAARMAQHLSAALNQPFDWRSHKLVLSACCGVALAPQDGRDADSVIRHARMALGAAQDAPAKVKVFTQSLDREAVARLTLEREMRGALERNEFRAYFQPKINLATGRIEACEALARWIRPDRTIISPGRFIPVAEESGLIGPLSDAIMREACWKAAAWARAGQPAKVAVNVSALQFRSDRFAENVLRVVQHAGLAPEQLELEITESVALEDPDRALRIIQPLRDAGVRLAIDDFGVGHSSLAALSKLPFDVIKIDQHFVRALERGEAQADAIVEMILALARTLGLEVVAEGVERREEIEFMAARGCKWVQGFFYGAAVSAPEFAELLRRQAGDDVAAEDAA